eukprot:5949847-Heterocapsa_arctica.AAC.1
MAVRKSKVKQWAMKLNDVRSSPLGTLVWEIAARGELARLKRIHFAVAYIYCSKCYERVEHKVAPDTAVKTGCNNTMVSIYQCSWCS